MYFVVTIRHQPWLTRLRRLRWRWWHCSQEGLVAERPVWGVIAGVWARAPGSFEEGGNDDQAANNYWVLAVCRALAGVISFWSVGQPEEVDTLIIPVLLMQKMRPRGLGRHPEPCCGAGSLAAACALDHGPTEAGVEWTGKEEAKDRKSCRGVNPRISSAWIRGAGGAV